MRSSSPPPASEARPGTAPRRPLAGTQVEVFFSYSHADAALRDELERHLALLERLGYVRAWHDRRIEPGDAWAAQIDEHLETAQVILLLVSPDFLASPYCYDLELRRALERHARGEAVVVPILLRPVDWEGAPFAHLQLLPAGARPVTTWEDRDEAFAEIARSLRQLVTRRFLEVPPAPAGSSSSSTEAERRLPLPTVVTRDRVLDAALADTVVVGHPTELLAFVRRSGAAGLATFLAVEETALAPEDVRSRAFRLEFPVDDAGAPAPADVTIALASPEFQPPAQRKTVRVPPDGDSVICRFLLVPTCTGELTVSVELSVGEIHQAARALRTRAQAGSREVIVAGMGIVSIPLVTSARPRREATDKAMRASDQAMSARPLPEWPASVPVPGPHVAFPERPQLQPTLHVPFPERPTPRPVPPAARPASQPKQERAQGADLRAALEHTGELALPRPAARSSGRRRWLAAGLVVVALAALAAAAALVLR